MFQFIKFDKLVFGLLTFCVALPLVSRAASVCEDSEAQSYSFCGDQSYDWNLESHGWVFDSIPDLKELPVQITFSYSDSGIYDICILAVNLCGVDTYTDTLSVMIYPTPIAKFTPDSIVECIPMSVDFGIIPVSFSGRWDSDSTFSETQDSFTVKLIREYSHETKVTNNESSKYFYLKCETKPEFGIENRDELIKNPNVIYLTGNQVIFRFAIQLKPINCQVAVTDEGEIVSHTSAGFWLIIMTLGMFFKSFPIIRWLFFHRAYKNIDEKVRQFVAENRLGDAIGLLEKRTRHRAHRHERDHIILMKSQLLKLEMDEIKAFRQEGHEIAYNRLRKAVLTFADK
ncbi:MAG: hypothetical protein AAFP89_27470 [Bacteroidota bacterium]